MFTGRRGPNRNMTTRQYARLVSEWMAASTALAEMMHLYPVGSLTRYRQEGDYQPGPETDYLHDGLRKAGMPEE